jgi:hypothetical protein
METRHEITTDLKQEGFKADDEFQQAFTSYQKQFQAALEESADLLRQAISTAQQSISERLEPAMLEQAQSNLTKAVEFRPEPITAKAVDEAFARASQIWEKVEAASAPARPLPNAQEPVPAGEGLVEEAPSGLVADKPAGEPPADPLAATQSLIAQATQSLNSAMEAVLQAMNREGRP